MEKEREDFKEEERESTSVKVSLNEILCPSFSVSTSTPSQSKRRAEGRVDEEAEQVTPMEALLLITELALVVLTPTRVPNNDDDNAVTLGALLLKMEVLA